MDPLTTEEVTALFENVQNEFGWKPDSTAGRRILRLFATIRDRERERDALTEALRDALSEVENTCYPTSKEKIAYLRDQKYKLPIVERERDDKEYARKEWAETAHRVILERDELQRKLEQAHRDITHMLEGGTAGCDKCVDIQKRFDARLAAPVQEGEGGTE